MDNVVLVERDSSGSTCKAVGGVLLVLSISVPAFLLACLALLAWRLLG